MNGIMAPSDACRWQEKCDSVASEEGAYTKGSFTETTIGSSLVSIVRP